MQFLFYRIYSKTMVLLFYFVILYCNMVGSEPNVCNDVDGIQDSIDKLSKLSIYFHTFKDIFKDNILVRISHYWYIWSFSGYQNASQWIQLSKYSLVGKYHKWRKLFHLILWYQDALDCIPGNAVLMRMKKRIITRPRNVLVRQKFPRRYK